MDFWLWRWSFKEAPLPLLWGWGRPVTCPTSHRCELDSTVWWRRPSWSHYFLLFWPTTSLSAIHAWWAWWCQSQSWVSFFLDFPLWGKKYLHQLFFSFFQTNLHWSFGTHVPNQLENTRSPIIIWIHGCELPSFFSNLCGLPWCGNTGCITCVSLLLSSCPARGPFVFFIADFFSFSSHSHPC